MNLNNLTFAKNEALLHIFDFFNDLAGGDCHIIMWHREGEQLKISTTWNTPHDDFTNEPLIDIHSDNLLGRTVRSEKHQQSDHVGTEKLFDGERLKNTFNEKGILVFPVTLKNQVVSVIGILLNNPGQISDKAKTQMGKLTELIATVIENLLIKHLSTQMIELTSGLKSITSINKVMQAVVTAAHKLTNADSSIIFLFDPKNETFSFGARLPKGDTPVTAPRTNGLTRRILDQPEPYYTGDASSDPYAQSARGTRRNLSIIGIRIVANERKVGVFYVRKKEKHFFSSHHVEALKYLSAQVSSTLAGSHFFYQSAADIQEATSGVYHVESQFKTISTEIKQKWGFDAVSIHLIRHGEKFIETVHIDPPDGLSPIQDLSNQAKFSLNHDSTEDILTHVVEKKTIELISGWCDLFDRWVYEINHHEEYIRIWLPILNVRNEHGEILYPASDQWTFEKQKNKETFSTHYNEQGNRITTHVAIQSDECFPLCQDSCPMKISQQWKL